MIQLTYDEPAVWAGLDEFGDVMLRIEDDERITEVTLDDRACEYLIRFIHDARKE